MKKIVALLMLVLISGCAEKQEYEETVLAQMKAEKDLKDYKITPEQMTKCIVQTSSEKMPGLFLVDPERLTAYKNYSKMLKLNDSADPKKTLEELRTDFGTPKGLADAHANYTESYMECISGLVTNTEQELINDKQKPE
jgi:hypothetical protein